MDQCHERVELKVRWGSEGRKKEEEKRKHEKGRQEKWEERGEAIRLTTPISEFGDKFPLWLWLAEMGAGYPRTYGWWLRIITATKEGVELSQPWTENRISQCLRSLSLRIMNGTWGSGQRTLCIPSPSRARELGSRPALCLGTTRLPG